MPGGCWSPAPARGLGAALTAARSAPAATRCWRPTSTATGSTCASTSPATTTGPRRSPTSSRPGAGSTSWSTTPGVAGGGRLDVASLDEWRWITDINLFGVVRGTRAFVPLLKAQRSGHVVNVASLAGLVHPAGMASYNAVKAAVVALTETTGHELAAYGVRASVVCPSYFRTGLVDRMRGEDAALGAVIGQLVETAPLGPDEIAAEVLAGHRPRRGADPARPGRPRGVRAQAAATGRRTTPSMRHQAARLQELRMSDDESGAGPRRGRLRRRGASPAWLREHAAEHWRDRLDGTPDVRQFPGGASNLTYRLAGPAPTLILRRPPSGREGEGRPRHGPRAPDPGRARAGLPAGAGDGRPLRRRGGDRLAVLRDDPGRGHHPAPRARRRPRRAADLDPVRQRSGTCWSSCTPSTSTPAGLDDARQGGGVRRPPGVRLDHPPRQRPHRRHGRLVRHHRLARDRAARRRRQLPDPQRLPPRQPRALARRPGAHRRRPRLGDGHASATR